MLAVLTASLVLCTVELEADGTYFAVCQGRRDLMATEAKRLVEQEHMGAFCQAYEYDVFEAAPSFVVVCD